MKKEKAVKEQLILHISPSHFSLRQPFHEQPKSTLAEEQPP